MFGADAVRCVRRSNGGGEDPYWSNVVTLLHFDGDLTDESTVNNSFTSQGSVSITNSDSMFGGSSAFFSGGYIRSDVYIPELDLLLGGVPYTIEMWIKPGSNSDRWIVSGGGGTVGWGGTSHIHYLITKSPDLTLTFQVSSGNSTPLVFETSKKITLNTWQFIAVCYDGNGNFYISIDGIVETFQGTPVRPSGNPLFRIASINTTPYTASNYDGYIDELRITKGFARYTENFMPPTEPFPEG